MICGKNKGTNNFVVYLVLLKRAVQSVLYFQIMPIDYDAHTVQVYIWAQEICKVRQTEW